MSRFERKSILPMLPMLSTLFLVGGIGPSLAQPAPAGPGNPTLTYADQGWSAADRDAFYTTSQGSRMMPYDWYKALRRLDVDEPFGADQLQRYGYLPNERSTNNLPVGFVTDDRPTPKQLGMTCAACHTGQIEYQKDGSTRQLRIDGAPANADFQLFLTELTAAARETSRDSGRFDAFARAVLGASYSTAAADKLKTDFDAWVGDFGEFMDKSLPPSPWGPGRLDAFNMIFNRVAVRGLGLSTNFKIADAPTSYPFVWNASKQDHTQWNGSVQNGLYIHALARNTGEVFGVFGKFTPVAVPHLPGMPTPILYDNNSADFAGLQALEEKIVALKPPPWPRDIFPIDDAKVARGKQLFAANCNECHGVKKSTTVLEAWATPVQVVGTDAKVSANAATRKVDSGLLAGSLIPRPIGATLSNPAPATDLLANSVVGTLIAGTFRGDDAIQRAIELDLDNMRRSRQLSAAGKLKLVHDSLKDLFRVPPAAVKGAYETRVLHGIWATAPYLHNGSVPTLWELLTPPKDRKATFMVGSRLFDAKDVGFVTDQSPFKSGNFTADPANANGNGNGGHVYGTTLSETDRRALLEYLKTL
jgi:hypothetical protein